jgi:hypothetical protein
MPKVPMESFQEGEEIVRVYLAAAKLEAERVERTLDAIGVAYAVEVETYPGGGLLGATARTGAGIWVAAADVDRGAEALERAGLVSGLVDRGER